MRKHKVNLEASALGFAAHDSSTDPEATPEEIFPIPIYGNLLRTNLWINVLQTSDVKVTASIQPEAKLNLKIRVSIK